VEPFSGFGRDGVQDVLRRNRELVLAAMAILAISGLYLGIVNAMGIPEARGLFGHSIGVLGFLLMLATETLYSFRKRVVHRPWGSMNQWLRFHIFTGIVGPYMVLLHSAWSFRGLAGLVMLLTILVVLSGFIGRYIYTAVPRMVDGAEIEIRELEKRVEITRADLRRVLGPQAEQLLDERAPKEAGPGLILGRGPMSWVRHLRRWAELRALDPAARLQAKEMDILVSRLSELQRQQGSMATARRMLSTWHTIHIPLGMALFTAALFHIGAALYYATLLK
jgi:hypothetical protein